MDCSIYCKINYVNLTIEKRTNVLYNVFMNEKTGGDIVDNRIYIAIDLKSFYASVECVERNLDALTTNLVVADEGRKAKTICLAVSPSLKTYGIPGRPRLFEVIARVKEANEVRLHNAGLREFSGSSVFDTQLRADISLAIDYIVAKPRMGLYMEYSGRIFSIYLKYVSEEDMHVYSVDEVFIDATAYLNTYGITARELAIRMIRDVYETTGITATAGIGTNMYLCKVAMDIVAKHAMPDENGVRIAELDEMSYRRLLWNHRPITDFWRVGPGYAKKLAKHMIYTMGDVARCSVGGQNDYYNEDLLYRLFGINAELLIDHAWGYEPTRISDIKSYRPENNSISQGQVLKEPYSFKKARLIVKEMTDMLVLDLVDKRIVTNQMVLTVGYDICNDYDGEYTLDRYGRRVPKSAHGSINIDRYTSSTRIIMQKVLELYDRIVNPELFVRRMYVVANHVIYEKDAEAKGSYEQLDIFTDYEALEEKRIEEERELSKERHLQEAAIEIKKKFGKNALLKGMNLEEGATAKDRNRQIGGHLA